MNKISFAMGLHFHQPVGNFEEILDRSYRNCYKPFLETFSKYPEVKMTFHLSGNLLDYFQDSHPEFLDKVKALVDSGRVEIMGGGYYEPIFQAIPTQDRIGQVQMLSDYCENRFGRRPLGMWVPERVWSPEFIKDLYSCGVRYTVLDDTHLMKAGLSEDELYSYFTTTRQGSRLAIFPSSKALRYSIPFKAPRQITEYFRKIAKDRKDILFTYGDDVEKFGEWPWTYDWVYRKGWLDNFFKELTKNRHWIELVTFSEYMDSHVPRRDVSIPEASYEEMLEWSEGSWMNFLSKYPESNQMHKRMLYVSRKISEVDAPDSTEELKAARKELYKAQTNCAYWHGVFGGIYLYNLRSAVYEHLINADRIIDNIEHKSQEGWKAVKRVDLYKSGKDSVVCESKDFFMSIDPGCGGIIRELDYKPRSINLINTLARRMEPYHRKAIERLNNRITSPLKIYEAMKSVDKRIKRGIFYDRHLRSCLVDHFIGRDLEKRDFADCNYTDSGDFADGAYTVNLKDGKVILERDGKVSGTPVFITKEIYIYSEKEIGILYIIKNKGTNRLDTYFGTEFNITMPDAESGEALMFSTEPEKIWNFPVETVSQSERSYDMNYQSTCIFPIWHIGLGAGEEKRIDISWRMFAQGPVLKGA